LRAEKEGKRPQEYVEFWHQRDLKDFSDTGIAFDFFHKTSSKENIELVQHFFTLLHNKGLIYKNEITQMFCDYDQKFLPDRYVVGTCPYCATKNQYSDGCENCGRAFTHSEILEPKCAICSRSPIMKSSLHYFFKLSALSSRLRDWLNKNQNLQGEIKNYVTRWIDDGLKDWDITREITWGVPIPLDEARGKVLYGWFDNHLCYISSTLLHLKNRGIDGKSFWNSSQLFHFIGKDIVYHHFLFLPAMRMGVDEYKLPEFIPTRGHLMLKGEKFSKSRGWYISLREFLDVFPADYLRYYFSRITSYDQSDVNFDWDDFAAKINNELVASVGNFIHRTLSFISTRFDGKVPGRGELSEEDLVFSERIRSIPIQVGELLQKNEIDRGIGSILEFSSVCNQYFQHKAPWSNKEQGFTTLNLCANAVRTLAILLMPYLPFSMTNLLNQLKLSISTLNWTNAGLLAVPEGHEISAPPRKSCQARSFMKAL
jgi:methionyl-tRNA synthetase